MNDKIDKLFGQALDKAVPETWTTLDPKQLTKLKDKFAQLIVQECIQVINREWYKENNIEPEKDPRSIGIHIGEKGGLIRATNAVAKHFGIRE